MPSLKPSLISASVPLKVPFYDVDPMDVVWHGHYAKYFEAARCEVLEVIGYGYQEMKLSGYSWPVIDLHIRYIKPARLGMVLQCEATIVEYENRLKIVYEVTSGGERLTKGHSIQVAVDMKTNEMLLASPEVLYEKISAVNHHV